MSNVDWTALKHYLEHSRDLEYKQLIDKAHDDLEFCNSIEKALQENVAVVDESKYIDYAVLFHKNIVNLYVLATFVSVI